jgi:hypothetical protein
MRGMRGCGAAFQEGPPLAGRKTAVEHRTRLLREGRLWCWRVLLRGVSRVCAHFEEGAVLVARAGLFG